MYLKVKTPIIYIGFWEVSSRPKFYMWSFSSNHWQMQGPYLRELVGASCPAHTCLACHASHVISEEGCSQGQPHPSPSSWGLSICCVCICSPGQNSSVVRLLWSYFLLSSCFCGSPDSIWLSKHSCGLKFIFFTFGVKEFLTGLRKLVACLFSEIDFICVLWNVH